MAMSFLIVIQPLDWRIDYRGPRGMVQHLYIQWSPAATATASPALITDLWRQDPAPRFSSGALDCVYWSPRSPRGASLSARPWVDLWPSRFRLFIPTMSCEGTSYRSPVRLAHLYDEGERILRFSVTVEHPPIASVLENSTYTHPGEKYHQTLGRDPSAVKNTHLPSAVQKYLQHSDQYQDAGWFAEISTYAHNNKNARAISRYNRWLHLPRNVRTAAHCLSLIRLDMPYVRCEEDED